MKKALIRIMKKDVKSIIDNKLSDKGIYIEFNSREERIMCLTAIRNVFPNKDIRYFD